MCGIIGICSSSSIENRTWILSGRDAMQHRGPDDFGEWWSPDKTVGFGHRRLSIIDLSAAGHQPMEDSSGNLVIVFNGEIYNYRELRDELTGKGYSFQSHSDTEVLLIGFREWGDELLSKLNGMFAFAIYDNLAKKVFLARDRAGEKPLFYCFKDGELRFASELKGIMADSTFPRKVDRDALDCYLAMGFIPGKHCILDGVNKLEAAHAMCFDCQNGSLRVWRYWNLPEFQSTDPVDEECLLDEFEHLFQDAVGRQLIADVSVGVLLSGGVDSSLVTAMAVRGSQRVKTFTVGNPGHGKYDETEHARLIANHFGTDHIELQVGDIVPELLFTLARQFDEPLNDSSMIPTYLVSQLIRQHCKVALGGDGGDELFGGYHSHDRMAFLQKRMSMVPRFIRWPIALAALHGLPEGLLGRELLKTVGIDLKKDVPLYSGQFDLPSRKRLTSNFTGWRFVAESIRQGRIPLTRDAVQRVTRLDFANYMVDDILVKVDRASMLNSLEIRAPLLDYRIIEFAFRKVPSNLKATSGSRKIFLKKLSQRVLPASFDKQRKQGFGIPIPFWLKKGPWREFFKAILYDESSSFPSAYITSLLDGIDSNKPCSSKLFGLVLFELWRREYKVAL